MISCPSCKTLNPEGESACLACGSSLSGTSDAIHTSAGNAGTGARGQTVVEDAHATTCPNGHPIDPSWASCPYCQRSSPASIKATTASEDLRKTRLEEKPSSSRRTRLAGEPPSSSHPPPPPPPSGHRDLKTTRLEESVAKPQAPRRTVLTPGTKAPGGAPAQAVAQQPASSVEDTRRLVAVLAAPELRPGGAVFAIRAGKNTLGADPNSDICLREDPQVSQEHALLLFRQNRFHLADRMSTNGTWINDVELEGTHAIILNDRDRIQCGETELIFLALDPSITSTGTETELDIEGEDS